MKSKKLRKGVSTFLSIALTATMPGVQSLSVIAQEEDGPKPVLHVSFDDGSADDKSGHANNGTVVGEPEYTEGKMGKAIHLVNSTNRNDDARQYVNFGQPADLQFGDGNFTVMLWYKADASSQTEGAIVSNKYWVSGGNKGFTMGDMKNGVTLNITGDTGGRKDTTRYPAATDGAWHHVSAVIDRSGSKTMKLFIDGKLSQSVDISGVGGTVDVADFLLGASNKQGSDKKFLAVDDANIDELQVYKDALSVEEIWDLGIAPALDERKEAVVKVSFDKEDATDESGSENNGTVVGNPEFGEGVSGKALHLVNSENRDDEARQYVNFGQPDDLKFNTGSFSVLFWYKANADIDTEGAIVSNKNWVTGANPGFTIGDMRQGVTFNMNTPGNSRVDTGRYSEATDGTWHHVAAVADRGLSNTMTLYIDGKEMQSRSISGLTGSIDVSDFLIGASNNTSNNTKDLAVADAWIDEFSVYRRAVTPKEVAADMAKYQASIEVSRILDSLDTITAGERFPQAAIDEMKAACENAKEAMRQPDANIQQIFEELNAKYEIFAEGTPAKMTFHLMSDSHITSAAGDKADRFVKALKDMKAIGMDNSAFLIAGDLTEYGLDGEMAAFYSLFDANIPVDPDKAMIALGNHDMRGNSGWEDDPQDINHHYPVIEASYKKHNAKYMPEGCNTMYYDQWINGYHFLVLNSENSPKDVAYLSDAQLAWMEEEIAENADPSKPVFVLVHQALDDTHRGAMTYGGFGKQDKAVKAILEKYPQTVFISGHIHNKFGTVEVMDSPYGTLIDTPVFNGQGYGYEVYVYDTELYLRARNFADGAWLPQFDVDVQLDTLPSLVKRANNLVEADYTADSWKEAKPAIDAAKAKAESYLSLTFGNYGKDKRFEINKVQKELKNALNLLKADAPVQDARVLLKEAIDYANAQKENGALEGLNELVIEFFNTSLAKAQDVYADDKASDKEVADAWKQLTEAIQMLEFKGDKTDLRNVIADADALNPYGYVHDEAWTAFESARAQAKAVESDELALQDEIDAACSALRDAMGHLSAKAPEDIVDKRMLDQAIVYAGKQIDNGALDGLNEVVKEKFLAALDAAKAVSADGEATRDEVDEAWQNLVKMIQMLDHKSDKTELQKAVDECEKITEADYEQDDAWITYQAALADAKEALESPTILQDRIDEITRTLLDAMNGLHEKVEKRVLEQTVSYAHEVVTEDVLATLNEYVAKEIREALAQAEAVLADVNATQQEVDTAWERLANALQLLEFTVDKTQLNEAIADAKAINGDDYMHDGAWIAFEKALANAEKVAADDTVLQNSIDQAYVELRAAMDALSEKQPEGVNKTLLDQAIAYAHEKIADGSLEGTNELVKEKFNAALAAAEAVFADDNATQDEVDQAWSDLTEAIHMLDYKSDKTILKETIARAEAKDPDAYTHDKAWKNFQNALANAKAVDADPYALQARIDEANVNLLAAMDALNEKDPDAEVNKTLLSEAIARANAEIEGGALDGLNEIVKDAFLAALETANTVFADDNADQAAVDEAWKNLVEMIQMLDFKADKTELDAAIKDAEAINGDDYKHDAAWDAFQTALADAKAVQADKKALQDRIDEAADALRAAMDALNENTPDVEVDKSLLNKAISYADNKAAEGALEGVNEVVVEKFNAALAAAKAVSADDSATQDEVNDAWRELVKMIQMLDFKADKTELEKAIADADALDADAYEHDDAWTAYEAALAEAKAVQSDKTALQAEIDEAVDALRGAMDALNEKTPEVTVDKSLLEKAITHAEAEMAKPEYENVHPIVKEALTDALAKANAVFADDNATQDEVNAAWNRLTEIIHMLDFKADMTELDKAIADADALDANAYEHDDAWSAFEAALAEAKAVREDKFALQARIDEATVALRAAMDALNEKAPEVTVDKSLLDQAIAEANAQIEAGCLEHLNTIVKDKFLAALDTANTVSAKEDAAQDEVDAAWRELVKMLQMLDFKSDKTELDKAIADAEAIDADAYEHDDAWDAFQAALDTAKEVAASDTALQDRIDAATDALRDAMSGLSEIMPEDVDKSELQKVITDAKAIDADAYEHDDAWSAFEEKLAKAESVFADENADQSAVDEATEALRAAMGALNEKTPETEVNKIILDATIRYAHEEIENGALEHLNELVKEKFDAALARAEEVSADADATQDEVNEAWKNLAEALQMLDFKSDKTELEQAIKDAEAIDGDLYEHDDAWTAFEDALANAKDVLGDKKALQDRIDKACDALRDAIDALNEKASEEFDLSQLNTAIAKADKIFNDSAAFKSGTPAWSDFEAKLAAAKSVHDDPQSQDEINQTARDLSSSMIRLRLSASKDRLDQMK